APNPLSSSYVSGAPDLGPDRGYPEGKRVLSSSGSGPTPGAPKTAKISDLPPGIESSAATISIVSRPGPKAKASLLGESTKAREGPLAVLIPGTTWVSKIWPADQWSGLAKELIQAANYQIVIVGGPADVQTNQAIEKDLVAATRGGVLNLTGRTSILE